MARGLATAGLLGLACNIGVLTVPLFNMEMFNRVLPTRDIATLWAMCGALAITLTCYAVLDHLRCAALGALGNRLARMLSPQVLQAIASFGPPDAAARSLSNGGSAAPRGEPLHDLEMVRQFVASPICVAPLDLVWTPVLLGVLLAQHWGYAVLGTLCCAVLCGLNVLGDTVARGQLLRSSHSEAGRVRAVAGAARAAEAVLAMGMLPALARRWDEMERPARMAANRAMLRSRAIAALTRTLRMAMTAAMVTLGLVLVLAGDASSGSMVAGNMILARLLLPFEQISNTYRAWIEALAAWRRLRGVLDAPPVERYVTALPRPQGGLLVERLVHIPSGGDRPVLRGVSFDLPPGEILGVIGPSGAGKSTLLRLILGMAQPTAGGVFLDGHSTFLWEREDLARHVGYVPQSLALVAGTVADNIARMQHPDLAEVRRAALRAGIHGVIAALPHGYATDVAGFTLSAGQRQRVALARALYGTPRLLVLDEPSAFLDQDGEAGLGALLARLREAGTGAIVVTHRPALLAAADKLLVLRDGLVDRFGPRLQVLQALNDPPVRFVHAVAQAPASSPIEDSTGAAAAVHPEPHVAAS